MNAKPFEADIMTLARGDHVDRGNAEIPENLRAEPDLAPLVLAPACFFVILAVATLRPVALLMGDADRTFAQIDDDAALALAHRFHDAVQPVAGAEHVGH